MRDAACQLANSFHFLLTGFAENAAIGNGLLPPGMAVITKPFQVTDFAKKVAEIIEYSPC